MIPPSARSFIEARTILVRTTDGISRRSYTSQYMQQEPPQYMLGAQRTSTIGSKKEMKPECTFAGMRLSVIWTLLRKEWQVELRQRYALAGVVLLAIGIVFIIFKAFNEVSPRLWGTMIWVVTLFAGINAIVKSFVQENSGTYMYYYTTVHPLENLISKLIYNTLFLLVLMGIIIGAFVLFGGNPIKDGSLMTMGVLLGGLGMSILFTFVSAISGAAGQQATMMSILALPLTLPVVLLLIKITSVALRLIQDSTITQDLMMLAGIDVLLLGVCLLLYPTVWRG